MSLRRPTSFTFALPLAAVALLALAFLDTAPRSADAQSANAQSSTRFRNPGFEDGGLFNPTDWDTTVAGVPTVLFYWDPDVKHGGARSASVVNAGDAIPVWHNWNQMIPKAGDLVGKDLELTIWVKSAQMSGGRGYVMLQAYRDTIMNRALELGVARDVARQQMGYKFADDPQLELGWARQYFSADIEEWTQKKVRLYIPPTTDLVIIRLGIFGAGQVWFDDAQLAVRPAATTPLPLGKNLLANPGFESALDAWEFSMPPTPQASITRDSTTVHSGRWSAKFQAPVRAAFQTYMNVCQVWNARNLSGRRVRLSGWGKVDGLTDSAYLSVFSTGLYGVDATLAGDAFTGTRDWSFYSVEFDVPKDTYTVWARAGVQASPGTTWWDDLKFEVLGATPKGR